MADTTTMTNNDVCEKCGQLLKAERARATETDRANSYERVLKAIAALPNQKRASAMAHAELESAKHAAAFVARIDARQDARGD